MCCAPMTDIQAFEANVLANNGIWKPSNQTNYDDSPIKRKWTTNSDQSSTRYPRSLQPHLQEDQTLICAELKEPNGEKRLEWLADPILFQVNGVGRYDHNCCFAALVASLLILIFSAFERSLWLTHKTNISAVELWLEPNGCWRPRIALPSNWSDRQKQSYKNHFSHSLVRSGETIYVRVGDYDLTSQVGSRGAQTQKVSTTYIHHNHNGQTLDNGEFPLYPIFCLTFCLQILHFWNCNHR